MTKNQSIDEDGSVYKSLNVSMDFRLKERLLSEVKWFEKHISFRNGTDDETVLNLLKETKENLLKILNYINKSEVEDHGDREHNTDLTKSTGRTRQNETDAISFRSEVKNEKEMNSSDLWTTPVKEDLRDTERMELTELKSNSSAWQNSSENAELQNNNFNSSSKKEINWWDPIRTERTNVSDWWDSVGRDVNEMLIGKAFCFQMKFHCWTNISTYIKSCDCDSLCHLYGDCCLDQAAKLPPKEDPKFLQKINCERDDPWANYSTVGKLLVESCEESMQGTIEEDLCKRTVPLELWGIELDIPVTSLSTNYTYRNYYCALCNGDAGNLLKLNMKLECFPHSENLTFEEISRNGQYIPGSRSYKRHIMSDSLGWHPVHGRLKEPETQVCFFHIRKCDPSWPVLSDFEKCQSYSFRVYDSTRNVWFKNPHCAKCNFVNMSSNLACTDYLSSFPGGRGGAASFEILFDISFNRNQNCGEDSIWNPIANRCNKIACRSGRILRGRKCFDQRSESHKMLTSISGNNVSTDGCPTISFNKSDFEFYDNGSIYFSSNNKYYSVDEYEIHNESVILICGEETYYQALSTLHYYTTLVVLSISLICLAVHILLYACISHMQTWHGRNLVCLSCSLFIAQFVFLTGTTDITNFEFCMFLSISLHYFWLVSFCWMNVLSIDVWRTFRTKLHHASFNNRKIFLYYSLYAFALPLLVIIIGLALDLSNVSTSFRPHYAGYNILNLCWITSRMGLLFFFLLPVGIIVLANFILFILTSRAIYNQSKETQFARTRTQSVRNAMSNTATSQEKMSEDKQRFAMYLRLGILQGLTWVTGFLASFINSSACWYIFIVLNGLQGAFILIFFDLKKRVLVSVGEMVSVWASKCSKQKFAKPASPKVYFIKTRKCANPMDKPTSPDHNSIWNTCMKKLPHGSAIDNKDQNFILKDRDQESEDQQNVLQSETTSPSDEVNIIS